MNTSAPICISSYIKGGNPRPKGSQGASRRQASSTKQALDTILKAIAEVMYLVVQPLTLELYQARL